MLDWTRNSAATLSGDMEPWPMVTKASIRVVAWPDYTSAMEIDLVLTVVEPLFGRTDACLCLRHDPDVDISLDEAVVALEKAASRFERIGFLHVLMVDGQMLQTDWPRVGVNAFCAIQTNPNDWDIRSEFIRVQRLKIVNEAEEKMWPFPK